jgi:TM2 domain-containing membrane protein YozV
MDYRQPEQEYPQQYQQQQYQQQQYQQQQYQQQQYPQQHQQQQYQQQQYSQQYQQQYQPPYQQQYQQPQWQQEQQWGSQEKLTSVSEKQWLTAFLLFIFLGPLGIHRFYVGKIGTGILQMLTFGGFGIWTLVDYILLITGDFKDSNGQVLYRKTIRGGDKSWVTTILLCYFLGPLGIHRFYVGKIGTGILQMLTFGGFGIWTLVDYILLLTGDFKDSNGMPLDRPK